MKKNNFIYFNEKIIKGEKNMTFETILDGNFRIDIALYSNIVNIDNENDVVFNCLQKILNSDGRIEIGTAQIDGNMQYTTKISPDYKLAWNTLKNLNIIVEVE